MKLLINILCFVFLFSGSVHAGGHLWDINELYSNSDGTIQFVELHVPMAAANENFMVNKFIRSASTGIEFLFPENLAGDTSFKHLLIATSGFANLPGAPTPDYILPDNFLGLGSDVITWDVYDSWTYPTPGLPMDGINSIQKNLSTGNLFIAPNTPTNYSEVSGSVDASGPPPTPPVASFTIDTATGAAPLLVNFTDTSASSSPIVSWVWEMGDGDSSNLQSPSHSYTSPGSYTVSLTATNAAGSDVMTCQTCITVTDPGPVTPDFVRGDVNQDLTLDITDPIALLGYLFSGSSNNCTQALDANDDSSLNLADAVSLLGYLFSGSASPGAPFPSCGSDPTPGGALSCSTFACP
jgi:PKD repeat protein